MALVTLNDANLTAIADAIRAKGVEGNFTPAQMAPAIAQIAASSGGFDMSNWQWAVQTPTNSTATITATVAPLEKMKLLIAVTSSSSSSTTMQQLVVFMPDLGLVKSKQDGYDFYLPTFSIQQTDNYYNYWCYGYPSSKDSVTFQGQGSCGVIGLQYRGDGKYVLAKGGNIISKNSPIKDGFTISGSTGNLYAIKNYPITLAYEG